MTKIGEHAVVIGASMGGLLAARSLTEAYERVTVVDRDGLPAGHQGRRAVPQGRHPHVLLPRGQACLDSLLPGFSAGLVGAGAPACAALEEMRFVIGGHQLARASRGTRSVLASRPFIEGHVRRRVRELPRVTLIDGCDALGLTTSRDGERVTGVRIPRLTDGGAEETLAADLVVAATGRAARVPAWLDALGCPTPTEERLDVGVTYASRRVSLPPDPLPEVEGRRPARVRVINAYLRRLRATAEHDPAVAGDFSAVVGMLEPPRRVLRPAIAARVARGPRRLSWSERVEGVRVRELRVGELRTPLREAGPPDAAEAVVFLHGNPGSSADWEPLLAATGRRWRAVAWDAPGFGRATAPADFRQTVASHAELVGRALDALGIERAHLVAHDFGGPWGLAWAIREPRRFASAVLLGTGALPGYRWHALARLWRTPYAGELSMAAATRRGFRLLLRRGNPRGLPAPFVDRMYDDLDRATRRAVLELYRSVPDVAVADERLAEAFARSTDRRSCCGAVMTPTSPSRTPSASARPSRARRSACSSEAATGPSSTTRPRSPRR